MIQLKEICFSYGNKSVVNGINLRIEKGSTQVLLGLSGSGKTTTLKLINGLLKPDSGEVYLNGRNLAELNLLQVRRKMGYVIQQVGLFPHLTVYENVALAPEILKWDKARIREQVYAYLKKLHLDPESLVHKMPADLSGGQQQRVGLARALAADPDVLLMDEPFGALDPITRQNIRKEFIELKEWKEKTVVLVTHDVQEAFEMGDKVAIMHQGKLIQNDTPTSILAAPTNEFVQSFLADNLLSLHLRTTGYYHPLQQKLKEGKLNLDELANHD